MLIDEVGVEKTLQLVGAMATLTFFRDFYEKTTSSQADLVCSHIQYHGLLLTIFQRGSNGKGKIVTYLQILSC